MRLTINTSKTVGRIKPMNAVNNGPIYTEVDHQNATNLPEYKAANIPFARTHDASIDYYYGGDHTVDVHAIFPDFDADPYDPASYDFALTDIYLRHIKLAGAEIFYRLGSKIEHWDKHYGIFPPKDFEKWAVICEHIIRHMNEGWADGHHFDIKYWEIWNEPNVRNCWLGTREQYVDLYAVTAKHLRKCFPDIKIGGPATAFYDESLLRPFLQRVRDEKLPLDFYSWHRYTDSPEKVVEAARQHRALLEEYGLGNVESVLNEWNYIGGTGASAWGGESWLNSLRVMRSMKGAAYISAVMTACQHDSVDLLMYYDARSNSPMNGLFSIYDYAPVKGYYPVKVWGEMLSMGGECEVTCDVPDIWAASAVKDGESVTLITYYTDDDDALPQRFTVRMDTDRVLTLWLLDEEHDLTPIERIAPDEGKFELTMKPNTVVVLR